MDALLAAYNEHTFQGMREHAILLFLYNSGARASEAAQLKIANINWHAKNVLIVGKGNKERRCPLWKSTLGLIHQLVDKRDMSEAVFLNRCHQPITRSGIYALVKRCTERASKEVP